MRARLFARFGPEAGLDVEFADEATIGRGKDNRVLLSSREVSQHHARVFYDADSGAYYLEDLGSLNGTRLDGEPVAGRERLSGLHVLGFGGAAEIFFLELGEEPTGTETAPEEAAGIDPEAPTRSPDGAPQREGTRIDADVPTLPPGLRPRDLEKARAGRPGSATRIEQAAVELPPGLSGDDAAEEAPAAAPGFALEVLDEPGGRFDLVEGDNLLGRSGRARIVLRHRELSRRHATLRLATGRVWLRDEGSRNHTYVADEQIADEVEIGPGAELRFGRLRARLVAVAGAEREAE